MDASWTIIVDGEWNECVHVTDWQAKDLLGKYRCLLKARVKIWAIFLKIHFLLVASYKIPLARSASESAKASHASPTLILWLHYTIWQVKLNWNQINHLILTQTIVKKKRKPKHCFWLQEAVSKLRPYYNKLNASSLQHFLGPEKNVFFFLLREKKDTSA